MFNKKITRLIVSFSLFFILTLTACSPEPPSRFEQAQQDSIAAGNKNTAVSEDAVKGESFNQFFPVSSGDYERVFTQEKAGFVQANLKFKDQNVATLAIFDTISNPTAKNDFANASEEIKGFPTVEKGSTQTAVLVGDRYQVSIRSSDPTFTAEQRKEWLNKFDLANLAKQK